MKKCSTCLVQKQLHSFAKRKSTKDGLSGQCRECIKKKSSEYKSLHKERLSELQKIYYKENINSIKERASRYYAENSEKLIAYSAAWRAENPERVKSQRQSYYLENRDKILASRKDRYVSMDKEKEKERRKNYYEANKDKEHQYSNEYQKARRASDPVFALKCKIRCMISDSMASSGYKNDSSAEEILGCSFIEFKNHIERQFLDGMSWENRSEWHIDHIVPLATAASIADVISLNHHTNLRPLWADENLKKGSKIHFLL